MTRGLTLAALAAEHPEWEMWLGLYGIARDAVDDAAWKAAVPDAPGETLPLVARTTFEIDAALGARLLDALLDRARTARAPQRTVPAVFEAAIADDSDRLRALAVEAGADGARFVTAAALAVMPLLQRCREAWQGGVRAEYMDAACPICGAWATLAEARGLERQLRLRCGRCGADWAGQVLRCAFCATTEHAQLGALVGETARETRRVDTCAVCGAYMKTVTSLMPCAPADVRLHDLATVDLDVAALGQGYARPESQPVDVQVVARPLRTRRRGLVLWRR